MGGDAAPGTHPKQSDDGRDAQAEPLPGALCAKRPSGHTALVDTQRRPQVDMDVGDGVDPEFTCEGGNLVAEHVEQARGCRLRLHIEFVGQREEYGTCRIWLNRFGILSLSEDRERALRAGNRRLERHAVAGLAGGPCLRELRLRLVELVRQPR